MIEKESDDHILLRAFINRGIFSGNDVHGLWCLVKLQKVNSEFIVKAFLYIASLGVNSREILNDVETSDGAWLMLAKIEKGREGFCIVSVRAKPGCWEQIDDANALAKQQVSNRGDVVEQREVQQEVSNRADVDEQREALRRDLSMILDNIFSGLKLNDTTTKNGMLEVYNRIYKGLLKMLYELPLDFQKNLVASFKGHSFEFPSKNQIAIFLDIENCPIPSKLSPEDASDNIIVCLERETNRKWEVISISTYAVSLSEDVKVGLQRAHVNFIETPKVKKKKDAADKAIIVALFEYAYNYPPPSSIMLISGDVDFANALRVLRQWGHNIILVIPPHVSPTLTKVAHEVWPWSNVARGEDLVPTSSSQVAEEKLSDSTGVSMESQLQLLSPDDVTPVKPIDGLKNDLVELLVNFEGSLLLNSISLKYRERFHKPIHVKDYRARKLEDLLKRMSDVFSVERVDEEKVVMLKRMINQDLQ